MNERDRFEPGLPEDGRTPRWAEAVRRELDAHADELDGATLSRLNRARQRALAAAGGRSWFGLGGRGRLWLPVAGAAEHVGAPGRLDLHLLGAPNRYRADALYELHVWAWRDNPNGTFVDWNPRVSCDGAE